MLGKVSRMIKKRKGNTKEVKISRNISYRSNAGQGVAAYNNASGLVLSLGQLIINTVFPRDTGRLLRTTSAVQRMLVSQH